jgi:macrolide-specific efflux system membrane fusion protein
MPTACRCTLLFLLLSALIPLARGADVLGATSVEVESVVVSLIAEVELAAEEAGPLVELAAREGRRVNAGDRLGKLDDRDAALQVERAQITLKHAEEQAQNKVKLLKAEETLKLARLELDRATTANQSLSGVVSQTQLSKLQLEVRRAELDVQQAQEDQAAARRAVEAAANELALAGRARERRQILAPMDGVVVEVRRRVGEWLEPGKVVLRLVRADHLRASGFVKVERLTAPLEGQPATLLVVLADGKEHAFTGQVTFVSPEANPINRQVKLIAEFDNRDGRLRAGLPAKMTVAIGPAASRSGTSAP